MKQLIQIAFLSLCAALLLAACDRNRHTPDPEDQKTLLSFSASSQDIPVKADEGAELKPLEHDTFGVWAIARKAGNNQPYILWETAAMSPVIKNGSGYYPQSEAFWISGYKYSFIAIAPWEDWQEDENSLSVNSASGNEQVSFTYDMATKYGDGDDRDLDFNLMAAVGYNEVAGPAGAHPSVQELNFHHLFTKICIAVNFDGTTGVVNEMRLLNVDTKADYTISFSSANSIGIGYSHMSDTDPALSAVEKNLTITREDLDENQQSQWTLHILPQDISDFELYLDFEIGDVKTKNFKIDLTAAKAVEYLRNKWYNWNIKINPKGISFDVIVSPWTDASDYDSDFEFDFEDEQE